MRIIWITILLIGCSSHQEPGMPPPNPDAGNTPGRFRFLALGDSYTIGESVGVSERWPVQLAAALRKEGIDVGDPQIIAVTGWTTANLAAGMDREDPQGPFDLVSLQIGVNNQYQGRPAEEFRDELDCLMKRAIGLAGDRPSRVLVLSIPDYGVTPFAAGGGRDKIAKEIDQFNDIKRDAAKRFKVQYVDVTPASRRAAEDRSLIAEDGLHPSATMYARWVELALPVVRKELQPDEP